MTDPIGTLVRIMEKISERTPEPNNPCPTRKEWDAMQRAAAQILSERN